MPKIDRQWIYERLKQSLQLLACPAEIQLNKFPEYVNAADEMALDFDHFREVCMANFRSEMTNEQLRCLAIIDESFEQMTKECFGLDGVTNSKEWRQIRQFAAKGLKAFNWQLEDPPKRDHEFVRGDGPNTTNVQ